MVLSPELVNSWHHTPVGHVLATGNQNVAKRDKSDEFAGTGTAELCNGS